MTSNTNPPEIIGILAGDEKVIQNIYDVIFPKIVAYVKKNQGSYDDAEEVFHSALYQLMVRAKVKPIKINSSFDAYLFTVCKNLWLKELNKAKREVRNDSTFQLMGEEDKHLESILDQERWELFEEKLAELSGNCAQLLKDYFNKVSYAQIVKKFSYASENAAFQRVFKCKKQLTKLIKKDSKYKKLLADD